MKGRRPSCSMRGKAAAEETGDLARSSIACISLSFVFWLHLVTYVHSYLQQYVVIGWLCDKTSLVRYDLLCKQLSSSRRPQTTNTWSYTDWVQKNSKISEKQRKAVHLWWQGHPRCLHQLGNLSVCRLSAGSHQPQLCCQQGLALL